MTETPTTGQKVAAEVIGSFVLVFFGCSAAILSGGDYVAIALAFGLAVLVGAYAFGRVSGAHFNPAVTVGAQALSSKSAKPTRSAQRRLTKRGIALGNAAGSTAS